MAKKIAPLFVALLVVLTLGLVYSNSQNFVVEAAPGEVVEIWTGEGSATAANPQMEFVSNAQGDVYIPISYLDNAPLQKVREYSLVWKVTGPGALTTSLKETHWDRCFGCTLDAAFKTSGLYPTFVVKQEVQPFQGTFDILPDSGRLMYVWLHLDLGTPGCLNFQVDSGTYVQHYQSAETVVTPNNFTVRHMVPNCNDPVPTPTPSPTPQPGNGTLSGTITMEAADGSDYVSQQGDWVNVTYTVTAQNGNVPNGYMAAEFPSYMGVDFVNGSNTGPCELDSNGRGTRLYTSFTEGVPVTCTFQGELSQPPAFPYLSVVLTYVDTDTNATSNVIATIPTSSCPDGQTWQPALNACGYGNFVPLIIK